MRAELKLRLAKVP